MRQWSWEPHWEWWQVEMGWQQLRAWAQRQRRMSPRPDAMAQLIDWAHGTRPEPTAPTPPRWRRLMKMRRRGAHLEKRG